MNKDNVKGKRSLCALCLLVIVASAAIGALTYYQGRAQRGESASCLFDGWVYGREDQKRASEALVAAGLVDFSWRSGQLFAPTGKRALYHAALANAGAYPKAPSEFRSEALRDMSVFESDAKSRMREMNACILQLERTIEQMRGVEYATVGARARREKTGLTYKTVITATVGVSLQESVDLNSDFLSAITLATKHQLGVDDVNNISIIDLKSGKSYCGIDSSVSTSAEVALATEKKRIEQYWRDKYMEAFADVKNIRVSIAADVVWQSDNQDSVSFNSGSAGSIADNLVNSVDPSPTTEMQNVLRIAPTLGRFETLVPDELEFQSGLGEDEGVVDNCVSDVESNGYFNSRAYAERISKSQGKGQFRSVAVARLGNPQRRRPYSNSDSCEGLYDRETQERGASKGGQASLISPKPLLVKTSLHNDALFSTAPLSEVDEIVRNLQYGGSDASMSDSDGDGDGGSPIRQASVELPAGKANSLKSGLQENRFFVRSLNARIAIPRSHIFQVALSKTPAPERSLLRPDSVLDNSFYLATEEKYLAETKRFAIDLLRPTSKIYGWTEEEFIEWITVVAYSDATDLEYEASSAPSNLSGSRHKAAYASTAGSETERHDTDAVDASYAAKSEENGVEKYGQDSCASNLTVRSTFVADTDGNLTTVAPTVATTAEGSETSDSDDQVEIALSSKGTWREKFWANAFLAKLVQPGMERNVAVAVVAGIAFLLFLWRTTRRREQRVELQKIKDQKEADSTGVACSPKEQRKVLKHSERRRARDSETNDRSVRPYTGVYEEGDEEFTDWDAGSADAYDDELENELREIAKNRSPNRTIAQRQFDVSHKDNVATKGKDEDERIDENEATDYWSKREEALKLIARYPERAVASLQRWVTGSES